MQDTCTCALVRHSSTTLLSDTLAQFLVKHLEGHLRQRLVEGTFQEHPCKKPLFLVESCSRSLTGNSITCPKGSTAQLLFTRYLGQIYKSQTQNELSPLRTLTVQYARAIHERKLCGFSTPAFALACRALIISITGPLPCSVTSGQLQPLDLKLLGRFFPLDRWKNLGQRVCNLLVALQYSRCTS